MGTLLPVEPLYRAGTGGDPVQGPVAGLSVPRGTSNPVLDLSECTSSHGVLAGPYCARYITVAAR